MFWATVVLAAAALSMVTFVWAIGRFERFRRFTDKYMVFKNENKQTLLTRLILIPIRLFLALGYLVLALLKLPITLFLLWRRRRNRKAIAKALTNRAIRRLRQ